MLLLLPAVAAFQPAPLRMLPRAARSGFLPVGKAGTDGQPADDVKITIRKPEARTAAPESVFVAQFAHVKPSVATFLKFWLMGGSADGWAGTGELEAQHSPSGTKASILVDVEQATVTLVSPSAASAAICAGAVSASLSPSGERDVLAAGAWTRTVGGGTRMPSTPKHAGLVSAEHVTPVDVITDESFGLAAVEGRLDVAPPPAAAARPAAACVSRSWTPPPPSRRPARESGAAGAPSPQPSCA